MGFFPAGRLSPVLLAVLVSACRVEPVGPLDIGPTGTNDTADTAAPPGSLSGVVGSEGAWISATISAGTLLERVDDGAQWAPEVELDGVSHWSVPHADPAATWRLVDSEGNAGPETTLEPLDATAEVPDQRLLWADETVLLGVSAATHAGVALWLHAELEGTSGRIDPTCLGEADTAWTTCFDDTIAGLPLDQSLSLILAADAPATIDLRLVVAPEALPDATLFSDDLELGTLGRTLLWGDLHAHSNLSQDGCEEPESGCDSREGEAGGDFFDQALSNDLDFAAMTEHAELELWYDGDATAREIWALQHDRIAEAEGTGLIPILGYEWTFGGGSNKTNEEGQIVGGHKTVLIEDPTACTAWRIAAFRGPDSRDKPQSEEFYAELNPIVAADATQLYTRLAEAAESSDDCEDTRALSFAHHSALPLPQITDWSNPDSAPDPDHEPVIEIHSEHGSSECADSEADGCDFGLNPEQGFMGTGSVQRALEAGYRLGFVGGTDSHDSRPGSLEDGPSATDSWSDTDEDGENGEDSEDEPLWQVHDGAVTGAMVVAPADRTALFDALFARETLVSSGPRLAVRAVLVDAEGALHLPGSDVASGDARLWVELPPDGADDLVSMELLRVGDSGLAAWTDGLSLDETVSLATDDVLYLRLRFENTDGDPERIWLSPWFVD